MTLTEKLFSRLIGADVRISKLFWPLQVFFGVAVYIAMGQGEDPTGSDVLLGLFVLAMGMISGASLIKKVD